MLIEQVMALLQGLFPGQRVTVFVRIGTGTPPDRPAPDLTQGVRALSNGHPHADAAGGVGGGGLSLIRALAAGMLHGLQYPAVATVGDDCHSCSKRTARDWLGSPGLGGTTCSPTCRWCSRHTSTTRAGGRGSCGRTP